MLLGKLIFAKQILGYTKYPFSRTHFTLSTSFKMFTFQHVVSFGSFFSVQNFKTD